MVVTRASRTVQIALRETTIKYVTMPVDEAVTYLPRGYSRDADGVNLWLRHNRGERAMKIGLPARFGQDTEPTVIEKLEIA